MFAWGWRCRIVGSGWETRSLFGDGESDRARPKPKKPGFFDHLCLDTDILSKNPISQPYRALPKPKKPGFFEPLCLDTDILVKTRFLTRAVSRSAQT